MFTKIYILLYLDYYIYLEILFLIKNNNLYSTIFRLLQFIVFLCETSTKDLYSTIFRLLHGIISNYDVRICIYILLYLDYYVIDISFQKIPQRFIFYYI